VLTKTFEKRIQNCSFKINFPILKISKTEKSNPELYKKINKELKNYFLKIDSYYNEFDCNLNATDSAAFTFNRSFAVKFQSAKIISLHHYSSSFTEGSPHPNNEYKTINYNVMTGDFIVAKEIFKISKPFKKAIQKLIKQDLLRQEIEAEPITEITDFYLTEDSIVFINLFDIYALATVEVKIPWKLLENFMQADFLSLLRSN
jgi:hypothetical protein